jgi:hypothetical protein
MLTKARIDSALRKLADSFLGDVRAVDSDKSGWGQFVGQPSGKQVGLYGTSAGLICVSLAYGPDHIPEACIRYLDALWQSRDLPGEGSRNFALTARRAFFLMALRQSQHPRLLDLIPEADKELRSRLLPDGLFVSWQIDANSRAATGNETATSFAILSYALSAADSAIPPEIERAAQSLQTRVEGALPPNLGLRKFILSSISLGVRADGLKSAIKKQIAKSKITPESRDQDAIYFWDYSYKGAAGPLSRRDYLHAPSAAIDILLACGHGVSRNQRRLALKLAEEATDSIIDSGLYFGGREPATSKTQAWIASALQESKKLIDEEENPQSTMFRCNFLKPFKW